MLMLSISLDKELILISNAEVLEVTSKTEFLELVCGLVDPESDDSRQDDDISDDAYAGLDGDEDDEEVEPLPEGPSDPDGDEAAKAQPLPEGQTDPKDIPSKTSITQVPPSGLVDMERKDAASEMTVTASSKWDGPPEQPRPLPESALPQKRTRVRSKRSETV